jgi:hypothetical protein
LLGDTSRSQITLHRLFQAVDNPHSWAAHFSYEWTLAMGAHVSFEGVDLFRLDLGSGRIRELTILYDTHQVRKALAPA